MARKTPTSDPSPESPALIHAQIPVIVHKADEGGYWAEVPALPGCFTQAETMEELKKNIQVAVDLYLEDNTTPAGVRGAGFVGGETAGDLRIGQSRQINRPTSRRKSS